MSVLSFLRLYSGGGGGNEDVRVSNSASSDIFPTACLESKLSIQSTDSSAHRNGERTRPKTLKEVIGSLHQISLQQEERDTPHTWHTPYQYWLHTWAQTPSSEPFTFSQDVRKLWICPKCSAHFHPLLVDSQKSTLRVLPRSRQWVVILLERSPLKYRWSLERQVLGTFHS